MQLSVVILNYNVRWFLQLCLESVQKSVANIDTEIIVVDNNSADDSCAMVKALFPNVKLIENKENSGFPKGNNIGVAQAKGEYICILNPDTVVAEDTFKKILAFANLQPKLGIVGCKLIDGTGKFLPESKRGIPKPFTAFGKVTGLYKVLPSVFGKYYASHLEESQTGEVEILVGAFMVMKRDTYLSVGGFDEDCFMYSDDIDLSYTVLKSGKKNFYFGETTVIHFKGESTIKDGLYMKRFREAMNFFYRKHFRVSPVFDLFMKFGAFLFSLKKREDAKVEIPKPNHYGVLPTNGPLFEKASKLLGKNLDGNRHVNEKKVNSSTARTQYWLDSEAMPFGEIIQEMQSLSANGNTFRILISSAAIGSDSSNDRGEVLTF
ncbi:glycosyltransferase family 2 protein [Flavobacterium sp. MAH-1]|uniref:Glycosyltransferase family 2 protein n=1 Tax=Flavobacterium agri TaxID=2743471 RepID=A0A7Y8Y203_9FLAO|nr:glycosyltransferase family 2 protein [Flavobacterium agri]NUY81102.1 glycosyltransferase family 2 protein [Flavobacterium agri]NYA71126.1 glycosyltransferase family 2 protein [Flavobacterium agri]